MKRTLVVLAVYLASYFVFSFTSWNINPKYWDVAIRFWFALIPAVLAASIIRNNKI